jgi:hypothetical protein
MGLPYGDAGWPCWLEELGFVVMLGAVSPPELPEEVEESWSVLCPKVAEAERHKIATMMAIG